ncbi:uncharacterized protein PG986_002414 [Apiospora aurea]|uniref:Nephrocystin 3-like N-terminal domain-containing protein n=1 Tax=Apiospora aurea TaxID=335848 RepID=A0ABR1QPA2_9PEZI
MEESKSKISATSMLGLRKLPLGLGKRRSRSRTSSISSKQSTEELSSGPAMAAVITNGNSGSPLKQPVKDAPQPLWSRVYEEATKVRKRIVREVHDVDDGHFDYVTLESYLAFISDGRLFHMPKKGSRWDRVLQEAEFFGLLIDEFSSTVGDLVSESAFVRDTALGGCQMLLELGCDQAEALEPTFNVLYEFGHLLGHLIHLRDLFTGNETITQSMSNLYASLVQLIGDIAVTYRQRISRLSSRNNAVSIDFDKEFSHQIRDVWTLRSRLFEHMWIRALRNEQDVTSKLTALRGKLAPSTSSEERSQLLYGRIAEKAERAEGTCEWAEDELVDFLESGEDLLAITGSPGCGKSVLSAWLRERLQRPIHVGRNRMKFETFGFAFASDNPEESTTLAFLKSMASQLLAINVGDARLLQRLMRSLDEWDLKRDAGKLETDLWAAIETGLVAINDRDVPAVIVLDALDEVADGDAKASILSEKLRVIASKLSQVRAVTLSRSTTQPAKPGVRHFSTTPNHLREDIRAYLQACLSTTTGLFSKQSRDKQQAFMSLVESRANGSFLYVYLISKLFTAGADFDTVNKSLSSNALNPLKELLAKVNFKDSGISRLFTFVIAAQRPLTVGEMEDILSVDLAERKKATSSVELAKLVSQTAGLIAIRDGVLRFKHASIRSHVLEQQCGQALPSLKDCHRQLTMTLLLFARIHLSRPHDPCLDGADSTLVHQVFRTHHIMEYVVYRWVSHFRRSSLVGKADELSLPSGFKEIFPESTLLSLLEWSTWQEDSTDAIQRHEWALRIRSPCLGEKHPSVLQGLIALGSLYRDRSDAHKASECFYKACTVGQVILFKFSPIVVSCTTLFLTCSEHISFTSRTTLCTYREEMVRFMIEVCKGQHGAHSDAVIRWYKVLAQLYVDIREEYMAAIIYKELQEIIVIRCGRDSKEAWAVRKSLAGLNIVLKKDDGSRSIGQVEETFFGSVEDLESTDEMRITILLRLATTYEAECKLLLAERLYLSLWQSISHACRHKATLELRLCHIDIAIKYVRFLERHQRVDEARNILLCLWAEYEHQHFESQTIIVHLKELALVFKAFGLLTISISILKRVWCWFQENKKAEDEEAVSTTVIITEVVEEITASSRPSRPSFSHLMAELLMESLLYEQYTAVVCNFSDSTNIEVVLEHAARLRYAWLARGRTSLVNLLDKKVFTLFMARYGQHLGDTKEAAAFTLYVALLAEIGTATKSDRATVDFALLTCRAVTAAVRTQLVEENDYASAHAVAGCGFRFAEAQRFYHRRRECLVYGYRLAELLAGHGMPNWKSADAGLKKKLQGASKTTLQLVMAAMKESGVEPVNLRFDDLSNLIHLLYEQENYEELEVSTEPPFEPPTTNLLTSSDLQRILLSLWRSREVQRTWSSDVVLRIGSLLVEAHARVPGHLDRALELCETMYYNVRQSRGGSSPKALDLGRRLASLLQYTGRAREAGRVHERILHDLDEMNNGYEDAGCGQRALEVRKERMRAAAETHLEGMRMCGWGGSGSGSSSPATPTSRQRSTADLYQRLADRYGKLGVPPVDKWEGKSVLENGSKGHVEFGSVSWVLDVTDDERKDAGESAGLKRDSIGPAKQRWGCWGRGPEAQLVR